MLQRKFNFKKQYFLWKMNGSLEAVTQRLVRLELK